MWALLLDIGKNCTCSVLKSETYAVFLTTHVTTLWVLKCVPLVISIGS